MAGGSGKWWWWKLPKSEEGGTSPIDVAPFQTEAKWTADGDMRSIALRSGKAQEESSCVAAFMVSANSTQNAFQKSKGRVRCSSATTEERRRPRRVTRFAQCLPWGHPPPRVSRRVRVRAQSSEWSGLTSFTRKQER